MLIQELERERRVVRDNPPDDRPLRAIPSGATSAVATIWAGTSGSMSVTGTTTNGTCTATDTKVVAISAVPPGISARTVMPSAALFGGRAVIDFTTSNTTSILALDSSQSAVNLGTISSPEAALTNTGGIRIVANDSTRPEVLRDHLLFASRNVIGMLNTWGGALVDQPRDRSMDARVALDLSIHRLYQLDERGAPLRGGTPTPGIEGIPSYRLNPVLVVQPLGQAEGLAADEPPIFARTGAFQAREVAIH